MGRRRRLVRAARTAEAVLILLLCAAVIGLLPVLTFEPAAAAAQPAHRAPPGRGLATTPAVRAGATGVAGLPEHVNTGALDPARACGQAAIATVTDFWHGGPAQGISVPAGSADSEVRALERRYGHDVEWGLSGTSPALMTRMAADAGLNPRWGSGEASLRAWVAAGYPVIVLQDVGPAWHELGMHWTVVYAFDDSGVYLSNWSGADGDTDFVSWSLFRSGWTDGVLMRGSGVAGRFLVTGP